uniref:ACT domain-containing protein ACR n=1 Tax=Medicago truncatula TaxID=3880 RepID=I3SAB1_MEDTR|nr:unknown [Medicago truncatula]
MALTNASIAPSFSVNATKLSDPLSIPLSSHTFFPLRPSSSAKNKNIVYASSYDLNAVDSASLISSKNLDSVPMPIVLIDQDSDSEATIVQLSFGDRLGALLDTMKALKDLGLDVSKGTVSTEGPVKQTKFLSHNQTLGAKSKILIC